MLQPQPRRPPAARISARTIPRFAAWVLVVSVLGSTSCGFLLTEALSPNRCMRCEAGTWSDDQCGGGTFDIEDDCKVAAYDQNTQCVCTEYEKEEARESK